MKEKDFVQMIQYFSHDLMNELQIIKGYLSMDKTEKVKDKVNDLINYYNRERKLIQVNAPKFILWLLHVRNVQQDLTLSYQIKIENRDLSMMDQILVNQAEHIINWVTTYGEENELYNLNIELCEYPNSVIKLIITVNGQISNQKYIEDLAMGKENRLQIKKIEDGIICEFSSFINE